MSARQYWTVLREERWLILVVVLAFVVAAVGAGILLPPTYTSSATFYVASPQVATSSTDSYQGAQLSSERVKSYTELLAGPRVAADASALLGGSPTPDEVQESVSADAVTETVVVDLDVTESTPEEAQTVASAVTLAFTRLVGSLEATGQPVNRPIVTTEVILPPSLPTTKSGPARALLIAAGLLAGVVLGVGAALVRRSLRRAVDSEGSLGELLGAPVLGRIPGGRAVPRRPAVLDEPSTGRTGGRARAVRARAESFRRLRTAVRIVGGSRRSLVVTGAGAGQSTSTTALELAATFAAGGERVLLVDADLRRPSLAARLGLDGSPGLADVLLGSIAPEAAVQRWETGGFDVLTAGSPVARPNEVLAHCGPVLARLAGAYRRVLVDTPSAVGAADAIDLSRMVDGVLLVARRGRAAPDDVLRAVSALRLVGARVLGGVLTDDTVPDAPVESRRAQVALPGVSGHAPAAIAGALPAAEGGYADGYAGVAPGSTAPGSEDLDAEDLATADLDAADLDAADLDAETSQLERSHLDAVIETAAAATPPPGETTAPPTAVAPRTPDADVPDADVPDADIAEEDVADAPDTSADPEKVSSGTGGPAATATAASAATGSEGARGAKTSGAKTSGAKTSGAKTSGAKTSGGRTTGGKKSAKKNRAKAQGPETARAATDPTARRGTAEGATGSRYRKAVAADGPEPDTADTADAADAGGQGISPTDGAASDAPSTDPSRRGAGKSSGRS